MEKIKVVGISLSTKNSEMWSDGAEVMQIVEFACLTAVIFATMPSSQPREGIRGNARQTVSQVVRNDYRR